ncbi:MAG: class I SAM-dependent methyltransferase [Candidatus Caenarcaniphilales bacterium]|nr:class I SAM-dependent methyltransferase [Candidatus Caenarcaniphilales bacterium]
MNLVDEYLENYVYESTKEESELLQELILRTSKSIPRPHMLTGRVVGRLLKLLVQIHRPKLVLEVGTFTGYSALSMAEGLPEDGKIITCEIDMRAKEIAEEFFQRSPYKNKIELKMAPALETIGALKDLIDFSFIDADKSAYPEYYEQILRRTKPGGLIVIDNALLSGRVLNQPDNSSKAVASLNKKITEDDRVENVFLTIRDGIQLIRKK